MANQTRKNTKARTSAPTVQRISKEEFNKLRKRSIRNKFIAGICTFVLGVGAGAGAYFGIKSAVDKKNPGTTPPPIQQEQEVTNKNVHYSSTNDIIGEASQTYTDEYIKFWKNYAQEFHKAYFEKDVTIELPINIRLFKGVNLGDEEYVVPIVTEYVGTISLDKIVVRGAYLDNELSTRLKISEEDIAKIFPETAGAKILQCMALNGGEPEEKAGLVYKFGNYVLYVTNFRELDKLQIEIASYKDQYISKEITELDFSVTIA